MSVNTQIPIPIVDNWNPNESDRMFTHSKNLLVAPINSVFKWGNNNNINYFWLSPKRSYSGDDSRSHCCLYLNYFEKYFDEEKEYFTNMAYIKFCMDYYDQQYTVQNFMYDIQKYILTPSIFKKVHDMVERNYSLELTYKSTNNAQLEYTQDHAKVLMSMSILMNLCIPLITHFAFLKRISEIDEFLLDVYDMILYAEPYRSVDIPSKLYITSISNVNRHEKNNEIIWGKQGIRGKDTLTHSMGIIRNIILNIMPKYTFDKNIVALNYTSINTTNKYQITDIAYEYAFVPLSSSKRDGEENSSEMDKYEQNLTKTNEALYLQSKINYQFTIEKLENMFGPFSRDEIDYYVEKLKNDNGEIINGFQKQLIFNLFYKYFGDTVSITGINIIWYVELMLASKKILSNMIFLPYIMSSKVEKIVLRKSLNKKELQIMESDPNYQLVIDKYKNDKIIKQVLGTIATIITSTFRIIDYNDPNLDGRLITVEPSIIIKEVLLYILLI